MPVGALRANHLRLRRHDNVLRLTCACDRARRATEKRRNSMRLGPAGPSTCQVETLVGWPAWHIAAGQVDVADRGDGHPSTLREVARVRGADQGGADTSNGFQGWDRDRRWVTCWPRSVP